MNKIVLALLTSLIVFFVYEKTGNNLVKSLQIGKSYPEQIETDLCRLVKLYYDQYIYPHSYPQIKFVIPSKFSATRDNVVHLLIHDPQTHEVFDHNTILQVGAHECAHALCGVDEENEHGPIFTSILDKLNTLAKKNNIFNPDLPIPKRYKDLCV